MSNFLVSNFLTQRREVMPTTTLDKLTGPVIMSLTAPALLGTVAYAQAVKMEGLIKVS